MAGRVLELRNRTEVVEGRHENQRAARSARDHADGIWGIVDVDVAEADLAHHGGDNVCARALVSGRRHDGAERDQHFGTPGCRAIQRRNGRLNRRIGDGALERGLREGVMRRERRDDRDKDRPAEASRSSWSSSRAVDFGHMLGS